MFVIVEKGSLDFLNVLYTQKTNKTLHWKVLLGTQRWFFMTSLRKNTFGTFVYRSLAP